MPSSQDGRGVALWIDTLCIPVDPRLHDERNQAIVLMKRTYTDARAVLVLDRDLQQVSRDSSKLEIAIRVLCCGWMRRLWTLQEASLVSEREPWKLNFQFQEGPLAHAALDTGLEAYYGSRTAGWPSAVDEVLLYDSLLCTIRTRIPPVHHLPQVSDTNTPFSVIATAVAHRSTSKARDEPLCMAGLMGFDVAAILQLKTAEERMMLFYTMLGQVPADLIFVRGMTKLQTAPFRWAPASILSSEFATLQCRWKPAGSCDTGGLCVVYKGFIFDNVDGSVANMQPRTRCIVQDLGTGAEYVVQADGCMAAKAPKSFTLPQQPALIFQMEAKRFVGAVVNLEGYTMHDHGQDLEWPANVYYWVEVVDHVSGSLVEASDITTDDKIEYLTGTMTGPGQVWMIT